MENVLAREIDNNLVDEICIDKGNIVNDMIDLSCRKSIKSIKLSLCVSYIREFNLNNVVINDELANKKVYEIAKELANAVDINSVDEVKRIKQKYGDTQEFAEAKEFLNKKCKHIWDVFENKHFKMKVPQQAMKALGITNKPSLEFLLDESLKYYEKDNGSTTVNIIESILSNPNIDYSFDEIVQYLKKSYSKERCKFNLITVKYLANKLEYNVDELNSLGASKSEVKEVFKSLSLKSKIKFIIKNLALKLA